MADCQPRIVGMKIKPNPRYDVFLAHLQGLKRPFVKWKGIAFRATPLRFANAVKLLDGRGSLKAGGRWSAAGSFGAVNLSTTQESAVEESSASFTYYNFAPSDVRPKVLVGVRLRLTKVLDLVDPRGLRMLPWVGLEELLAEDWRKVNDAGHEALSQALGRAAHASGAEGLLAPSARVAGAINVVYFPDSLTASSEVEILGEEELTRWLKKR
jgi:RES domain-containing protein